MMNLDRILRTTMLVVVAWAATWSNGFAEPATHQLANCHEPAPGTVDWDAINDRYTTYYAEYIGDKKFQGHENRIDISYIDCGYIIIVEWRPGPEASIAKFGPAAQALLFDKRDFLLIGTVPIPEVSS